MIGYCKLSILNVFLFKLPFATHLSICLLNLQSFSHTLYSDSFPIWHSAQDLAYRWWPFLVVFPQLTIKPGMCRTNKFLSSENYTYMPLFIKITYDFFKRVGITSKWIPAFLQFRSMQESVRSPLQHVPLMLIGTPLQYSFLQHWAPFSNANGAFSWHFFGSMI